jgi:hypothetical protein
MLTNYPSPPAHVKDNRGQDLNSHCGFSRLLSAAVINQGFRDLLLSDPDRALAQGYYGEKFPLDFYQRNLVLSIRADSLSDFACQITSHLEEKTQLGCEQWIPVTQSAIVFDAE